MRYAHVCVCMCAHVLCHDCFASWTHPCTRVDTYCIHAQAQARQACMTYIRIHTHTHTQPKSNYPFSKVLPRGALEFKKMVPPMQVSSMCEHALGALYVCMLRMHAYAHSANTVSMVYMCAYMHTYIHRQTFFTCRCAWRVYTAYLHVCIIYTSANPYTCTP
jgi:hypothetical protein